VEGREKRIVDGRGRSGEINWSSITGKMVFLL